ncbi:MAG: serine/threonine-protein phosphatase [Phycisphaerales bacterium]|nr:serine/threonine-protein phosphatase [Phycisphaerales bacterium]
MSTKGLHTSEFAGEFEAHTLRLLKKRFVFFCAAGAIFGLSVTVIVLTAMLVRQFSDARDAAGVLPKLWGAVYNTGKAVGTSIVPISIFSASLLYVLRGKVREMALLRLSQYVVFGVGAFHFFVSGFQWATSIGWLEASLLLFFACVLLPWSARQATMVAVSLVGAHVASLILQGRTIAETIGWPMLSAGLFTFSVLIAWFKHSRYTQQFKFAVIQQRYGEVRRELTDARKIHEALFPGKIESGELRMSYEYEPMRQIGGDYLYAHQGPGVAGGRRLNIVLMDVTGHGIPAALTVNRLHGELERVFAEDPAIDPGRVLNLLNRYVHLTLATHSVYVTALCIRIDSGVNTLEYASGGHPPAFLVAADGTIRELQSTSFVLGACAAADFDAAPISTEFMSGDALVAYTDGAIEARDRSGRMLGVQGFLRLVASMAGASRSNQFSWAKQILSSVEQFRYGPAADDTLVVEITRPVTTDERLSRRTTAAVGVGAA